MKKIILCLWLPLFAFSVNAQTDNYSFSHDTIAYGEITGATKISNSNFFNVGIALSYLLPFEFKVKNIVADRMVINGYGEIQLLEKNKGWGIFLVPMSAKLQNYLEDGGVYFALTGTAGKQKLGIEFRKLELELMADDDIINYQVWLNEEDYSIEYRYANDTAILPGAYGSLKGPTIGIFDVEEGTYTYNKSFFLTGDPKSPVYSSVQLPGKPADTTTYLSANVPKNTRYTFTPSATTTGVATINNGGAFTVYPNPAYNTDIFIDLKGQVNAETRISINDVAGKEVFATTPEASITKVPTNNLQKGVYIVTVNINGAVLKKKVIVQ